MFRSLTLILAACLAIGVGSAQTVLSCVMDGQVSESCCCTGDDAKNDCGCPTKVVKKQQQWQALDAAKLWIALPAAPVVAVVEMPLAERADKLVGVDTQHWATGPPAFVRYCSYLI